MDFCIFWQDFVLIFSVFFLSFVLGQKAVTSNFTAFRMFAQLVQLLIQSTCKQGECSRSWELLQGKRVVEVISDIKFPFQWSSGWDLGDYFIARPELKKGKDVLYFALLTWAPDRGIEGWPPDIKYLFPTHHWSHQVKKPDNFLNSQIKNKTNWIFVHNKVLVLVRMIYFSFLLWI